eukprot:764179-Pyramimonas_sp.AAC.1
MRGRARQSRRRSSQSQQKELDRTRARDLEAKSQLPQLPELEPRALGKGPTWSAKCEGDDDRQHAMGERH